MEELSIKLLQKLEELDREYGEAEALTQAVEVCQDGKLLNFYTSKINRLRPVVTTYRKYRQTQADIETLGQLIELEKNVESRASLKAEADVKQELSKVLAKEIENAYQNLKLRANESAMVSLCNSSGTQAVEVLSQMLCKFAEQSGYSIAEQSDSGNNTFIIEGENSYTNLSKLSGLYSHLLRGREEQVSLLVFHKPISDVQIDEGDIRTELFKSSGAGGQHINKTESAVRLIHIPTGITAECQDERSQTKNRQRAYENLKAKILSFYQKNSKKQYEFEKKQQKNAIFAKTPRFIIDFDKNKFINAESKLSYNLKDILAGNLTALINDLEI